ncbi:unnamed protein product [Caenorhabditis auriculariae]|uniref:Transmembrane protein 144 n=1 Tax=Caenorhabditis auriculariae TaxID=2777116 RepID=A0A8S1H6E6_9PELO|nr:unnamed protein product [Caenorhabditis auriculariae]
MTVAIGLLACGISSLFFGSMFVPLKNFDASDGIFAQWMMSLAILIIGFVAFIFSNFPGFYPLAMLGGMSWTLGNATAIPIISRLGMALSMLIWNTTNCVVGWAGGRFGLFGMKAQPPASPVLNYAGLICVIIGGFLFSRIRSTKVVAEHRRVSLRLEPRSNADDAEKVALNPSLSPDDAVTKEVTEVSMEKAEGNQRAIGFLMAMGAGVFYGMTFVPVIYMIDNPEKFPGQPSEGLAYVFSHYFGIFLTATTLFVIYAIFKKNRPTVNGQLCLPALASGTLWGIAQTSFFVANQNLSQTVTFPIIAMTPGCIASAWSIFYYKDIQGRRNFITLAIAMCFTFTGAILVGLSKAIEL